ncbi:unnamed protein product [Lampetra fluviatilis]
MGAPHGLVDGEIMSAADISSTACRTRAGTVTCAALNRVGADKNANRLPDGSSTQPWRTSILRGIFCKKSVPNRQAPRDPDSVCDGDARGDCVGQVCDALRLAFGLRGAEVGGVENDGGATSCPGSARHPLETWPGRPRLKQVVGAFHGEETTFPCSLCSCRHPTSVLAR